VTGTAEVARVLLAAGAPVDGEPGERETPLITAASYGDAAVALVLVEAGADLEARAADDAGGVPGGTALLHAAVFGMTDVVDVLVAAGARVESVEVAAAAGDIRRWLDDAPADARLRALVMAADHERLHVIDGLVEAGTPIDGTDPVFGGHPLRTAASNGRAASVRHLLGLGAEPKLRDAQDRSALELARGGTTPGHREVVEVLAPLAGAD
jgi:ankyrin repeat protein